MRGGVASTTTTRGSEETTARPFRWNWVERDRIAPDRRRRGLVNSTLDRLIEKGWAESDGNGRVRPTPLFPADLSRALSMVEP
jgi:hypothetical protein